MKKSFLLSWLLYLALSMGVVVSAATLDQYWIAFGGEVTEDFPFSPKYLMKIDVLGNIILEPIKLTANPSITRVWGGTALSPAGPSRLNMWFARLDDDCCNRPGWPISRAAVDRSSVRKIAIERAGLRSANEDWISVSQKPANNFLVLCVFNSSFLQDIIGYSTSDPTKSWLLVEGPTAIEGDFSFAVSADGRAFVYARRNDSGAGFKFFFQPLGPGGRAVGKPELIERRTTGIGTDLRAADVTAPLKGGKRYILYEGKGASLFLQKVDDRTGTKVGERIRIQGSVGQAAIDPLGRFVIYTSGRQSTAPLLFQALDALGQPSGSPKIIATAVGGGLDILKD